MTHSLCRRAPRTHWAQLHAEASTLPGLPATLRWRCALGWPRRAIRMSTGERSGWCLGKKRVPQ